MREDLIERLRLKRDVWRGTEFGEDICELLDEAADTLEALRTEAEQHFQQAMRNGAKARRAERLEKALKDIRSLSSSINRDPFALTVLLSDIRHIADTALAERNDNG